ncbi:MAG: zf-HC2 domain-containing protein [Candidatus Omnitrophica bacterium]|nr:zf-HC2 domain-containing protein [Candidatus Omnitrophota bacterium]
MQCPKVSRLLNRYIDSELDQQLKDSLERHLQTCLNCKAEFNSLVSVQTVIRQQERITAQPGLMERLKAKLSPQAPVIKLRWLPEAGNLARRLIPVPAVAMIVLLLVMFANLNGVNPVDAYIFSDLSNEEIAILNGSVEVSDLLINGGV